MNFEINFYYILSSLKLYKIYYNIQKCIPQIKGLDPNIFCSFKVRTMRPLQCFSSQWTFSSTFSCIHIMHWWPLGWKYHVGVRWA